MNKNIKQFCFIKRLNLIRYLIPVFIFLLTILICLPFYNRGITLHDEGYILYISDLANRGAVLYKELFVQYPPGLFLLIAFLFKIFGTNILVGRIAIMIIGGIINIFLYFVSSRLVRLPFSILPSMLFLVWGIPQINFPWFTWFCLLFFLIELYLIRKKSPLLIIGIFSGLVFLFKQTFGFVAIGFALYQAIDRKRKKRESLLKVILGILLGFSPGIFYLLYTGSTIEGLQDIFISVAPFAKGELVFTPYPFFSLDLYKFFPSLSKQLLYLFPFFIFITTLLQKINNKDKAFIFFTLVFFLSGVYPTADILHFNLVLPIVFPVAVYLLTYMVDTKKKFVSFFLLAYCLFIFLIGVHKLFFRNYYAFESPYPLQVIPVEIGNNIIYTDNKHATIIKEIRREINNLTKPDDKIFVFHYSPLIYFFSGRDMVGRYIIIANGLINKDNQEKLINTIEKSNVKVIIMQINNDSQLIKAEDYGFAKEEILFNYLITNFKYHRQIENLQIRISDQTST